MLNSPLIQQVNTLKAAQVARETAELTRLVEAYQTIYKAINDQIQILLAKITQAGEGITPGQVAKMRAFKELQDSIIKELDQYKGFMTVEIRSNSAASIIAGERDARLMTSVAAGNGQIYAALRQLNPEVITQLVGFLDPRGPLYEHLGRLSDWTQEQVGNAILEGVGMGKNPRDIARILSKSIEDKMGMALTDSLRTMRTVQLWSYREANRASYLANSDVVQGWIWWAELDNETCGSCIAQHGSVHSLDETLDDHYNGRCQEIPQVIGVNPNVSAGKDWFDSLNEEQQKGILGASKWQAWKDGKFEFSALSKQVANEVYGHMRTEASLIDLIGEE